MANFLSLPAKARSSIFVHLEARDLTSLARTRKQLYHELVPVLQCRKYAELVIMNHTLAPAAFAHPSQAIDEITKNPDLMNAVQTIKYADHGECSCDECHTTFTNQIPVLVQQAGNYDDHLARLTFLSNEERDDWRADIVKYKRETILILLLNLCPNLSTLEITNIGSDAGSKLIERLLRVTAFMQSSYASAAACYAGTNQIASLRPQITHLVLDNIQGGHQQIYYSLLAYPTLKNVTLKGFELTPDIYPGSPPITSPAEYVELEGSPCGPTSSEVFGFIKGFPSLKFLKYYCQKWGGAALEHDSNFCPCNPNLLLTVDQLMMDPKSQAYLREHNLEVACTYEENAAGGRWNSEQKYIRAITVAKVKRERVSGLPELMSTEEVFEDQHTDVD